MTTIESERTFPDSMTALHDGCDTTCRQRCTDRAFARGRYLPTGFVAGSAGWTVIAAALTSNGMP